VEQNNFIAEIDSSMDVIYVYKRVMKGNIGGVYLN